jgi:DNA replication protein DnaC
MHQMLTQLKLARIREIHQDWLDRAAESQMPYPAFLRGLLQEELLAREDNQVRRRLKEAGFPFEKTLEDFDFRLRPELNRQVFLRYLDERFITQGRSCRRARWRTNGSASRVEMSMLVRRASG